MLLEIKEYDMNKLVSVIILTYNSADTILETLESVKAQVYSPLELVISDDCSKDNTIEVVEAWIKENRNAFYCIKKTYGEKNVGLSGNMNRGLKEAQGQYIKYLAADDLLFPNAIEKYVALAQMDSKVLPIGRVKLLLEEGRDAASVESYCEKCYAIARETGEKQYEKLLYSNWVVSPAADFFEKEALLLMGGYNEKYRLMEDYPMNMKLLKNGYYFGFIDEELVGYRISTGSITGSRAKELKKTEMKIFFGQKFWYMFLNGLGWEAIKQSKYWLKVLIGK